MASTGHPRGVVLLLGPPGSGKSTLGRFMARQAAGGSSSSSSSSSTSISFLSLGDELRARGLVAAQEAQPTAAGGRRLRQVAEELLRRACCGEGVIVTTAAAAAAAAAVAAVAAVAAGPQRAGEVPSSRRLLLLLEGVKELGDAHMLLRVLHECGVALQQVLFIPGGALNGWLWQSHVRAELQQQQSSAQRDKERRVAERQAKWEANVGRLLELFSSMGVLSELSVASTAAAPSLAALGYAAGPSFAVPKPPPAPQHSGLFGQRRSAYVTASRGVLTPAPPTPATPPPAWLAAASPLQLPSGLAVTPIECVTSRRLVADPLELDAVMAAAASLSGLGRLFSCSREANGAAAAAAGDAPLAAPVPSNMVCSSADAAWLARPGRYTVSRKCDGTRYLLLLLLSAGDSGVASGGGGADAATAARAYLLNRAKTMYKFPVALATAPSAAAAATAAAAAAASSGNGSGSAAAMAGAAAGLAVDHDGDSPPPPVPPSAGGTVLDGELVWMHGRGFFLAFDALCVGGCRLWHLPLQQRLLALEGLGLKEAEESPELCEAAAAARSAAATMTKAAATPSSSSSSRSSGIREGMGLTASSSRQLYKKQQAPPPGADTITLLRKRHLRVSPATVRLLGAGGCCPYPTDGLVFTPCDMPYQLGMPELLYKWQPPDAVGKDLTAAEVGEQQQRSFTCTELLPGLVYECLPQVRRTGGLVAYQPASVRWDKVRGNDRTAAEQLSAAAAGGCGPGSCEELAAWMQQQQQQQQQVATFAAARVGAAAPAAVEAAAVPLPRHPARTQRFADVHSQVLEQVAAGVVERWEDPAGSGLEVYSYRQNREAATAGPVAAMCRGLILHPPSESVVATPFARFGDAQPDDLAASVSAAASGVGPCMVCGCSSERDEHGDRICYCDACKQRGCQSSAPVLPVVGSGAASRQQRRFQSSAAVLRPSAGGWRLPALRATLLPPDCRQTDSSRGTGAAAWCPAANVPAAASVKVDGSMVVAFVWAGQLRTATRRRMDSEQALWASEWLRAHAEVSAFRPGWTYVMEAVYGNNTHVVPYGFEGLVLLSAVQPDGAELPLEALAALAAELRLTCAAPYLVGELDELLTQLPGFKRVRLPLAPEAAGGESTPTPAPVPAPASFEGWVLSAPYHGHDSASADCASARGTSGFPTPAEAPPPQRYKLVQAAYKRIAWAGRMLHPLCVWDKIAFGGASRGSLAAGLPRHYRAELAAMLETIGGGYAAARGEALRVLRQAARAGRLSDLRALAVRLGGDDEAGGAGAASGAAAAAGGGATTTGTDEELSALMAVLNLEAEQGAVAPGSDGAAAAASAAAAAAASASAAGAASDASTAEMVAGPAVANDGVDIGTQQQLHGRPTFWRAVAYAAARCGASDWTTAARADAACRLLAPSMYYDPDAASLGAPSLRRLLLECVQPAADGRLAGYTPSPTFAQTKAKGWAGGPAVGRLAPCAPPLLHEVLLDPYLEACLAPLQGRDLVAALTVCRKWADVLRAAPAPGDLAPRLAAGRAEAEAEAQRK
ncbi:hypothetical protein CHLRE_12g524850v5, partial [Chlamydomonas reinhardtii]